MSIAKRALILAALLPAAALGACTQGQSDPAYCGVARAGYQKAMAEVNQSLTRYSSCISASKGSGDCSAEFGSLRSDQSNLETSAADVAQYCPKNP